MACTMLLCVSAVSYGSDGAPTTKSDVVYSVDNPTDMYVSMEYISVDIASTSVDITSLSEYNFHTFDVSTNVDYNETYLDDIGINRNYYKYINNYSFKLDNEKEPDAYTSSYLRIRNFILNIIISAHDKDSKYDTPDRKSATEVLPVQIE